MFISSSTYCSGHAQVLAVRRLDVRARNALEEQLHVAALREGAVLGPEEVGRARRAEEARIVLEEVLEVRAGELLPAGVAESDAPGEVAALALLCGQRSCSRGEGESEESRRGGEHAHDDGGGG